jgi:phosphoribosylformylglycinamidine cyclo-ligase
VYRNYRVKRIVHGVAHITGGGLMDNPPRILPDGCSIRLVRGSWTVPAVFPWLKRLGSVDQAEMDHVFNMGIGLILVVAEHFAAAIVRRLNFAGKVPAWIIGEVVDGERSVVWD